MNVIISVLSVITATNGLTNIYAEVENWLIIRWRRQGGKSDGQKPGTEKKSKNCSGARAHTHPHYISLSLPLSHFNSLALFHSLFTLSLSLPHSVFLILTLFQHLMPSSLHLSLFLTPSLILSQSLTFTHTVFPSHSPSHSLPIAFSLSLSLSFSLLTNTRPRS